VRNLVIGHGEIGKAVCSVFGIEAWVDLDRKGTAAPGGYGIMHVCIPWTKDFVKIVEEYIKAYWPELTIIHSTVPIGTTRLLSGFKVHSPVRGRHDRLAEGIKDEYQSHIGYSKLEERDMIREYYISHTIHAGMMHNKYEVTEAAKLLSLLQYGVNIEFARYAKSVCDRYGVSYGESVSGYTESYNEGIREIDPNLTKPIMQPPDGKIGGHCVLPAIKILNGQIADNLLSSILVANGTRTESDDLAALQYLQDSPVGA